MTQLSNEDSKALKAMLGRDPSPVEAAIIATMWSEHCSYKSTRPLLKTLPTTGDAVALGVGQDAGIIKFATHNNTQYGIAISHESHNHPSQLLPVEGAATGVGGVVRDVYCMGADVIGVLNSLHFSKDKAYIERGVVQGIGDYANALGVPVLGGEVIYDPSYAGNCLVNVAAVGLVDLDQIIYSTVPDAATYTDYSLILLGKSTDATGFGGAAFSSESLASGANTGAVQVHDPFLKRVIVDTLHAIWAYVKTHDIQVGCKDLGAGGIACATSEITGQFGALIHLDKVNCIGESLPPEVIACSETQERFCLAVPTNHAAAICHIANSDFAMGDLYPNAGAVVIGHITKKADYTIYYHEQTVCNLPVKLITTPVSTNRVATPRVPVVTPDVIPDLSVDSAQVILNALKKDYAVNNRIYRRFDHGVRGEIAVIPGDGDAGVVVPIVGCHAGLSVTIDSVLYGHHDPYEAGVAAVAEAVRNTIAVGAEPLALTDCLNYGNPENSSVFHDIQAGIQGIGDAARAYQLPIVSGNVSLYNESDNQAVCPSPVIVCLGRLADYRQAKTIKFKRADTALMWLAPPPETLATPGFAGTAFATITQKSYTRVPQVALAYAVAQNKLCQHSHLNYTVYACHDVSTGGVALALLEMVRHTPEPLGCLITGVDELPLPALFSESGGYILEVDQAAVSGIQAAARAHNQACYVIGSVIPTACVDIRWRGYKLYA